MLKKYLLRRRIKKIEDGRPSENILYPEYLLNLSECIRDDYYLGLKPNDVKGFPVHMIRQNVEIFNEDVLLSLDCIEKGVGIPQRMSMNTGTVVIRPWDDFLTNNKKEPFYIEEVLNDVLSNVKCLLAGVRIYRVENNARYNYYVRKLQYLFADIYVLLETLLLIALR